MPPNYIYANMQEQIDRLDLTGDKPTSHVVITTLASQLHLYTRLRDLSLDLSEVTRKDLCTLVHALNHNSTIVSLGVYGASQLTLETLCKCLLGSHSLEILDLMWTSANGAIAPRLKWQYKMAPQ